MECCEPPLSRMPKGTRDIFVVVVDVKLMNKVQHFSLISWFSFLLDSFYLHPVLSSIGLWGPSVGSLHVLLVSVCVYSERSGFLLQSKIQNQFSVVNVT